MKLVKFISIFSLLLQINSCTVYQPGKIPVSGSPSASALPDVIIPSPSMTPQIPESTAYPVNNKIAFATIMATTGPSAEGFRDMNPDTKHNIQLIDPDGSGLTSIGKEAPVLPYLKWSPDKTKLFFICMNNSNLTNEICVIDVSDSTEMRVVENIPDTSTPRYSINIISMADWSPDNKKIVYISKSLYRNEISIVNAGGSETRVITSINGIRPPYYQDVSWSPDSQELAFIRHNQQTKEIHVIGKNG